MPLDNNTLQSYIWTSESVGPGHPDKVADQVSDAFLDACLAQDPKSRVACETLVKDNHVVLAGEITTTAVFDYHEVVVKTLHDIGYTYKPVVTNLLSQQSHEISQAVGEELEGAGDQGIMFGYATNETPNLMPLSIFLSKDIVNMLVEHRETDDSGIGQSLLPDCKTQVSVKYDSNGTALNVDRVVISTNHKQGPTLDQLRNGVKAMFDNRLRDGKFPKGLRHLYTNETKFDVNPAGLWHFGGPEADCGLTGRKIVVDGYGADCQWGGGALSGKDATKVDRSAAYMARYIAKNIVAEGIVNRATVQLSYSIGRSNPTSFRIITDNPKVDRELEANVLKLIDLRPRAIIERLDLLKPIFLATARYGHFGINSYSWEKVDLF